MTIADIGDVGARLLDGVGRVCGPARAADLLRRAGRRGNAREAFRLWQVEEALDSWLSALEDEAHLNGFGRISARWDAMRLLGNLARLHREEERNPAILDEPAQRPVFITGMPRSGTTFLHRLLGENPRNLVPRTWQTIYPYPPERGRDQRRDKVAAQLRSFLKLAPGLASVHPLDTDAPQECTEITAHVFRSLRFDTTHSAPSYRDWLERCGHRDAYRFHRRFLQHLQHQHRQGTGGGPPPRWVLKSPDHVFALDAIAQLHPDACFVFVHRHPLEVLASAARLTALLRAPFTSRLDPLAIGRQVARDWHDGAARMIAAARELAATPQRVLHLQFDALVARPLDTVLALCRHFDIELTPADLASVGALITRQRRGGYGVNRYELADYGLDRQTEFGRFRPYTDFFDVPVASGRQ